MVNQALYLTPMAYYQAYCKLPIESMTASTMLYSKHLEYHALSIGHIRGLLFKKANCTLFSKPHSKYSIDKVRLKSTIA